MAAKLLCVDPPHSGSATSRAAAESIAPSATWMPIAAFEGFYEVSSMGNVRRISSGRILKPALCGWDKRYYRVTLSKNNSKTNHFIHILVASAFFGGRPAELQCNHKNGITTDNRAENLEWCTASENTQHCWDALGRKSATVGEAHPFARLTRSIVAEIRASDLSAGQLAKHYGISESTIRDAMCGRTWASESSRTRHTRSGRAAAVLMAKQ